MKKLTFSEKKKSILLHKKIKTVTRFVEIGIVLIFLLLALLIRTQIAIAGGFLCSLFLVTVAEYYLWLRPVFKYEKVSDLPEQGWYEGTAGNWAG